MNPINQLIEEWKNDGRIFIFENGRSLAYSELAESVISQKLKLKSAPAQAVMMEAKNTFASYVKFLSLLSNGHAVLPCPTYQFRDDSYRTLVAHEIETDFVYCAASQDPAEVLSPIFQARLHPKIVDGMKKNEALFLIRTSGSSGKKYKFILHSLSRFIDKYKRIGPHFKKTLAFSPAESIAGIETLMEALTHGLSLVAAGDRLTPNAVADLLETHAVDYLQTTPSFLNLMLLSRRFRRENLKSLRKIAYGSEPSQRSTLAAIADELPGVEFKHTYGMSEIGILHTVTSPTDPSIFLPDPSLNPSRIIDGMLQVKSISHMSGYFNETPRMTDDGWFCTQDIAQAEGSFIRVLGRADDTINVGGRKFLPSELEDLILPLDNVGDVTVFAEENGIVGKAIVAEVVLRNEESFGDFQQRFRKYAEEAIPFFMVPHRLTIANENVVNPRFKKMRRR